MRHHSGIFHAIAYSVSMPLMVVLSAFYASRADEEHHASALLQARLRRHLTQRCEDPCEDPAHAGFVT